ncbi:post-GPI attachment to proteins factor 2 [Biomphalaria glabrata]|uniref:Post-GPI attachment to proteins factor 2-like n=1 Tax=Biomphalaria glabrata TaxID=6526 RepID=A0A2C9LMH2_BIOGL|nr:post-GPI attachment to proteins factor 2-like [Biomphalaria glabrata]KAI8757470.1 post-GPI attachment to proteins factor 2-like [Biomphalaria glabrata]KAI8798961.1 post-GPI attachment to proteins factor 2 [Biomphalaria glabrata]
MAKTKSKGVVEEIFLNIPMWPFAVVTVSLPGVALFVCFVTAVIFQFDDVNETMCNVKNFIPSISAVTGVTPQTYLWRTCIALHSTPRFAVCLFTYNHYVSRAHSVHPQRLAKYMFLIKVNFWLNFVENSCLTLVAYITNRENYPIHEKIFVVFMVTSLAYMLLNTILFNWSRAGSFSETDRVSYYWKKVMFASIATATAGLLASFILHRVYCVVGAFSVFSACEYVIAYTNMGYHFTAYLDFKDRSFLFGRLCPYPRNNNESSSLAVTNNNVKLKNKAH